MSRCIQSVQEWVLSSKTPGNHSQYSRETNSDLSSEDMRDTPELSRDSIEAFHFHVRIRTRYFGVVHLKCNDASDGTSKHFTGPAR